MRKMLWAAAAATAFISTAALATISITVNGDSVTGFIGKGDVQSLFGLNNPKMQAVVNNVTFTYSDEVTVDYTCQWTTGPDAHPTVHTQTFDRSGALTAVFNGPSRTNPNGSGTGWNISGNIYITGSLNSLHNVIPVLGGVCPDGSNKTVTDVELIDSGPSLTATVPGYGTKSMPTTGITVISA